MAIDAIARNKAEALIREQLVNTIQQDVPKSSTVMQLGTRLANMTSNQTLTANGRKSEPWECVWTS